MSIEQGFTIIYKQVLRCTEVIPIDVDVSSVMCCLMLSSKVILNNSTYIVITHCNDFYIWIFCDIIRRPSYPEIPEISFLKFQRCAEILVCL